MKKIATISKYFFKKNLKDIISFSIILFIATALFSSAVMINSNIMKDYDRQFERLNTADSFFIIPKTLYSDKLLEDIKNINGVTSAEAETGIMLSVPVDMDGSTQEQTQIFYNIESNNKINKREKIKKSNNKQDGIYLTNYTFIHSNENKNKYIFKVNDISYSFNIKGIVNEMQFGNYSSSVIGEYLQKDAYSKLLLNNKDKQVVTISVKAKDSHKAYNDISKYLSSNNISVLSKNYKEQAKTQRLAISNIIVLILMVFSSSMLIISLFVSKFKIEQTIEEEMSNMGALEALGYTSKEIIIANIFPYIISGLLFTLLGIGTSYLMLPTLSTIIEMQSGFKWNIKIDLLSNLLVLLINFSLITIFTLISSSKIRKLNPINAIRGINENKNNKNHFEIEKTQGNVNFILMLKNFVNTKKQNILLGIVLFLLTVVSSFIGILFYNININPINFINTLVEEHPSVVITANKDLRNDIRVQNNVKKVLYYDENGSVNYKDNSYKTFIAENYKNLANDLCYEGNNPKTANEVAVGSKIKETYNLKTGDYINLNKNGIEKKYKVVGFIQSVNYSGEVIELTVEGYKRLDSSYSPKTMYIYLKDEGKSKKFTNDIKKQYKNNITSTMNYAESMDSAMNMYVSLISIICIIIIVITLLLIYLILYILISSIITKRKQELGILKALGYSNKQLVRQLIGGFMPSAIVATILGFIVSKLVMNKIYKTIFNLVGAYKVSFEYPVIIFLAVAIFMIIITIVIGTILSRKIKKITVYSLIKD